ncbi:MAG TPA: head GIN domain-containing protein [Sphingobacteriaceae bacterium]
MKKHITPIALIAGFLISLSSFEASSATLVKIKSSRLLQEDRTVPKFTGINVGGPFETVITFGQKDEIRLEGDKETVSRIETHVENGILRIGFRDRNRGWNFNFDRAEKVKVFVTIRSLKSLAVSGSGRARVEGTVKGDSFSSAVSGSGSIIVNTDVKAYTGVISGSGSISATGASSSSKVTISGSGSFRGKDFKTMHAEVRISGSGNAAIHAEDHLEAALSGSGNIRYSGNPHVDLTKSGSGSISRL